MEQFAAAAPPWFTDAATAPQPPVSTEVVEAFADWRPETEDDLPANSPDPPPDPVVLARKLRVRLAEHPLVAPSIRVLARGYFRALARAEAQVAGELVVEDD